MANFLERLTWSFIKHKPLIPEVWDFFLITDTHKSIREMKFRFTIHITNRFYSKLTNGLGPTLCGLKDGLLY